MRSTHLFTAAGLAALVFLFTDTGESFAKQTFTSPSGVIIEYLKTSDTAETDMPSADSATSAPTDTESLGPEMPQQPMFKPTSRYAGAGWKYVRPDWTYKPRRDWTYHRPDDTYVPTESFKYIPTKSFRYIPRRAPW